MTYPSACAATDHVPPHLHGLSRDVAARERPDNVPLRLGVSTTKRWERGRILAVSFAGFSRAQVKLVLDTLAAGWSASANIAFREAVGGPAELRCVLNPAGGNWSAIGTDALIWPTNQYTVNLGQLTRGIILHEFGHSIGCYHNQSLPNFGVPLDWNRVVADMRQEQGWGEEQTRQQFTAVPPAEVEFSRANDLLSVMQYWIRASWRADGGPDIGPNDDLSAEDRTFAAMIYGPRDVGPIAPPPVVTPPPIVVTPPPGEDLIRLKWSSPKSLPYRAGQVVRVLLPDLARQTTLTIKVQDDLPVASPAVDLLPLGSETTTRLPMVPGIGRGVMKCRIQAGPGTVEARIQFRGEAPPTFRVSVTRI